MRLFSDARNVVGERTTNLICLFVRLGEESEDYWCFGSFKHSTILQSHIGYRMSTVATISANCTAESCSNQGKLSRLSQTVQKLESYSNKLFIYRIPWAVTSVQLYSVMREKSHIRGAFRDRKLDIEEFPVNRIILLLNCWSWFAWVDIQLDCIPFDVSSIWSIWEHSFPTPEVPYQCLWNMRKSQKKRRFYLVFENQAPLKKHSQSFDWKSFQLNFTRCFGSTATTKIYCVQLTNKLAAFQSVSFSAPTCNDLLQLLISVHPRCAVSVQMCIQLELLTVALTSATIQQLRVSSVI